MLDATQRRLLGELFATLGTSETVNGEPAINAKQALATIEESESWRFGLQWPNGQWVLIVPANEGNDWIVDYSLTLEPTVEALLYPASLQAVAADLTVAAGAIVTDRGIIFAEARP